MTMRLFYGLIYLCFTLAPALAQDEGYVLQVAGRLVFVDQGEQDNMRPGDFLQVVRQEVINHPETGENLAGEVALGAVRIIEVFPRLSTAEVVDLIKGMDLALLDREARQGLIRTRMLPPEAEMVVLERVHARASGMMAPAGKWNPDGVLGQFVAEVHLGLGSRPEIAWPAFTYQLVGASTVGTQLPSVILARVDSAFLGVQDVALLALADTASTPQELAPFGGAMATQIGLTYPFSRQFTFLADLGFGSSSQLSLGARFYAGRLVKFLGEGYTPDGQVGAPVITLKLGTAGQGTRTLSAAALAQLTVPTNLAADEIYALAVLDTALAVNELFSAFSTANPALITHADTLYQADVTQLLHAAANAGAGTLAKSGLGFSMGLTWPIARHFTLRGHWTSMGNIKGYGVGLTYYLRTVEKPGPDVNPDGRIRSLVFTLGGRYDTGTKQRVLDFDLVLPIAQRYTLSSVVATDLKSFMRFGLAFKTYFKGF
jgi:hypothetical protein